jgi:hypothetical protein
MSRPKLPTGRPARVKSVVVEGAPPALTPAELALLAAYRAMDGESKEMMLGAMRDVARDFPCAPRLRLVTGAGA